MIGSTVSHYRIVDSLGSGGMGVVYLAEDITLGRRVALKFLSSTTPEYRNRFLREARAVSRLVHPNIATVFDYGETDADHGERAKGTPYIVMELVKGTPLNEKLESGPLPLREAVRIVSAIAEALGEAHRQGVVHRDVKPSNVVVAETGQVKVLDFGLVKQIHDEAGSDDITAQLPISKTRSDVIVGTPLYLSPEQATGKKVDARSDLFALGAVLYECIAGQSAFAGSSVIEIGAQVIHVTPKVPSKLNPSVPPELDKITMRALEKKIEARYQTAEELISDLQAVLPKLDATESTLGGGLPRPLRQPRTHSASALTTINETFRRPRLSLAGLILGALALGLLVWVVYQWWKPAPYRPSPEVLDFYNRGVEALRNGAFLQASKAFEEAIANDKNFPLAHARAAEAYMELDYADKAQNAMLNAEALVGDRSHLAQSDSLYLSAINATVRRDFPAAIAAYEELGKLDPNEPRVYVDLGRAYEKNDELPKAVESYVQATQGTPQYASAFLRVAILYGRQGDQASAMAAFDKAEKLYEADGNFEGQAEVEYQRGYLFNQRGHIADAKQHLQRALEIARTTGNDYQQVKTLLKLGDVEVDEGAVESGRARMISALELAQAKGIENYTKRALVDIGNSYLAKAGYEDAERYYRQSLELSQRQNDKRNEARAWLALASLSDRLSKPDDVVKYVGQALPFYQQGGYRRESMQALHLLARANVDRGDYKVARQSFEEVIKLSQRIGDDQTAFIAHQDIGLLLIRQGRYHEALNHTDETYKLANKVGNKKTAALSRVDRANALWRLGRYEDARTALSEAALMAEKEGAARDLTAHYQLALSRMRLSERQPNEARQPLTRALETASTHITSVATLGRSTLGLLEALNGSRAGVAQCREAEKLARESKDPYLISETLLILAEALLHQRDFDGASKAALESQELAARIGKLDSEWISYSIAAQAAHNLDRSQEAQDYASRAEAALAQLEQHWGADNFKSYLDRPDIQISRKQLGDLVAVKPQSQ
ncbi:MAG TPA: tetratricopeptide repeat protein [Pyrinomonadaceae bacterium]|nr:tetratricopeptide repeat protein [Pyrinomonadaceae bacterium]